MNRSGINRKTNTIHPNISSAVELDDMHISNNLVCITPLSEITRTVNRFIFSSNTEKVNGFLLGYMHNILFPDSDIAKSYASRRTKTTCIINGAFAPSYQQALVERMRVKPFSIAIDGSSDNGLRT